MCIICLCVCWVVAMAVRYGYSLNAMSLISLFFSLCFYPCLSSKLLRGKTKRIPTNNSSANWGSLYAAGRSPRWRELRCIPVRWTHLVHHLWICISFLWEIKRCHIRATIFSRHAIRVVVVYARKTKKEKKTMESGQPSREWNRDRGRSRTPVQMVRGRITCSTCHLVDKINDSNFISLPTSSRLRPCRKRKNHWNGMMNVRTVSCISTKCSFLAKPFVSPRFDFNFPFLATRKLWLSPIEVLTAFVWHYFGAGIGERNGANHKPNVRF